MPRDLRLSHQTLRVLKAFLDEFAENVRAELAGADVMKAARVSSGTLYPILLRLERAGVLTSRWERKRPEILGRPRRRYYRITPAGVQVAHEALRDLSSPLANPVPSEV
jgi:PadR family transcriptional regulator, regulatory protein PadR